MAPARRPSIKSVSTTEAGRRSVRFDEFRQVVRRHRPSELLPALATLACSIEGPPYDYEYVRYMQPWAIALMARESVLWGNEHREKGLTPEDLRVLINTHNNIYEEPRRPEDMSAHSILTRIAYEQFPYQESMFEELTRTHALLIDGLPHIDGEVLDEAAWGKILGAPLPQVVGATFFLHVAAEQNQGWFDPAWLDRDDIQQIFDVWPRQVILERARRLSSSFEEFRAAYDAVQKPARGYERYAFNPLTSRPFLRWADGRLLAPQPRLILRTVSPGNLYYEGIQTLGEPFTRDLGRLTERYVGEQLRTIDGGGVHGEVVYGKPERKSTDWFLVLPSVVVMFEVKSARFGLLDRAADPGFEDRIKALLEKAVGQLRRSSAAIEDRVPEFSHIPGDRPRIGVVVTSEPYYLANTPMVRSLLPEGDLPLLTASLRELEHLVGLPTAAIEEQLLEIVQDPERSTWSLGTALKDVEGSGRSPLLQHAWDSYPWPLPDEDSTIDHDSGGAR